MDYLEVLSFDKHDALLKGSPTPAASVVDERQAHPNACAMADDVDDNKDWDLEMAVELEKLEQVGAKRRLNSKIVVVPRSAGFPKRFPRRSSSLPN